MLSLVLTPRCHSMPAWPPHPRSAAPLDDDDVRIRRRPAGSLDTPDTIRLAISALQHVLAADFQPEEVEVAVADASGFRKLTLEEIEEHLAAISERD
jgi:hypothetical protein